MCDVLDRYVHRVGRTARMGKVGEAVLFLMPAERAYLGNLEARGVQLRPLNVLPAFELLPPDTTQQVTADLQALHRTSTSLTKDACTCNALHLQRAGHVASLYE